MSEWKEFKLGDLVTFQRGHDLPRSEMIDGIYPVAGSNSIIGYHNNYTTKCPGITIGRSGNIGNPHLHKKDFWAHNTTLYVKEFKKVDPTFFYYLLKTLDFTQLNSGSAVPSLNRNFIHPFIVSIPENINTQTVIAKILSSLDDKIEVSNQINKDLEAIAQSLFKQWFIDFEFPNEYGAPFRSFGGEMVDSKFGKIPKEWVATNYGAVIKKENLKVRKSKINISNVYAAIKTSELVLSEDYFTKQVFSKSLDNYYVVENFWFAYNPSRINIGSIGLNKNEAGAVSPAYVVFSTIDNMHFYIENHLKLENIKREIIQKCSGTVRQALNYESLSTLPIVKPPKSIIDKFNNFWVENSNAISQIKKEIESLISLRDDLLPKLISGELEISDIQLNT